LLAWRVTAWDNGTEVRNASRKRWTSKGLLRRLAVATAGLLLTLAVVSSLAHAGGRYFYCDAMGFLLSDPCAAAFLSRDGSGPTDEVGELHADCCEVGTFRSMPDGTNTARRSVPPPALVAIVPAQLLDRLSNNNPGWSAQRFERRGVAPPSPNRRHAELMVFLA
jgi:hypothetical protein